jgi:hypothetical protein
MEDFLLILMRPSVFTVCFPKTRYELFPTSVVRLEVEKASAGITFPESDHT